jgi:hypothetical protein
LISFGSALSTAFLKASNFALSGLFAAIVASTCFNHSFNSFCACSGDLADVSANRLTASLKLFAHELRPEIAADSFPSEPFIMSANRVRLSVTVESTFLLIPVASASNVAGLNAANAGCGVGR